MIGFQAKAVEELKQPVILPPIPKAKPKTNSVLATKKTLVHLNELLVKETVAVTEPPPVLESIPQPKQLSLVEKELNKAAIVGQVHQVAPRLPIKASTGAFKAMLWDRLIPNKFRCVEFFKFNSNNV